jgi:TRAP transporter T-component
MRLEKIRGLMPLTLFSLLLFLTFTLGCAGTGVKKVGAPTPATGEKVSDAQDAQQLKDELESEISTISARVETSPNDSQLLRESARLYLAYGFLIEDEDPELAKELYTKGKEYGLRALKQDPQFKEGLESGKRLSELVVNCGEEYADALCWTGLNGGLWLFLNMNNPAILSQLGDVLSVVKRSIALDETYFYGIGKVFMGAYYALVPSFLEPEAGPENSARMFQEARSISDGKFLVVDLFEARFLDTKINNQDLFQKRLQHVISADPEALKDASLMNRLSQMKARYYLKHQGDFFLSS